MSSHRFGSPIAVVKGELLTHFDVSIRQQHDVRPSLLIEILPRSQITLTTVVDESSDAKLFALLGTVDAVSKRL